MSFVSEIGAMFVTGSLKRSCAIDGNDRVVYIVFSRGSTKTDLRSCSFCWLKPCIDRS